jgi:hypothetical protein
MKSQSLPQSVSYSKIFPSTKRYINEDFTHFPNAFYENLKRMLQNDESTKTGLRDKHETATRKNEDIFNM